MRYILLYILLISAFSLSYSQTSQNEGYQFFVNLNNVENDQLNVELITPKINSSSVLYRLPAMVPGTYKIYNFGRFVSNLKAFDASGNELSVNKEDTNSWSISDANKLYKITYKIDDTFEDTTGNPVFEPAGTSIDSGKVFVVNNHGFFGYFDDYVNSGYTITFTKPQGFFGATSLNALERNDSEEIFTAPDYHFLVDNPIIFSVPDTTSISFDEAKVLIAVYSPGKGMTSKDIAENNKTLLTAIRTYLGGKLPADRYTFLYYFSDNKTSSGYGALEHNYTSLYYMPDVPAQAKTFMLKQLMSTSAHEFYHTVTPLNLHSEEIGNFDFNNPVMSKHLWLYEGVTEYNADYIQLREGLITIPDYIKDMQGKLNTAARYNDSLPFTEMSKEVLGKYEKQYNNVYEKGALIGLCLDILIREESNGQTGLQDVINKLQEKYGKQKSFKDDDLFNDIEALTSPKVREFLDTYVAGPNRIPYEDIFSKVGIILIRQPYEVVNSGGGFEMGFDQKTYRLVIKKIESPDNKMIKELGIKDGDELISVNGEKINYLNARSMFGSVKKQVKAGDNFEIVIARKDANGNEIQKTLKAKITQTKTAHEYVLSLNNKLTDSQQKLKNSWLGK